MRRLHPVRRLSVVALIAAASIAAITASGPAGATGGTVACTQVSGNQMSAALFFDCSPSDSTGGSGTIASYPVFSGTHTGTIDWDAISQSQHATTEIRVTAHASKARKKNGVCPAGTKEVKVSGRVRTDTSGSVTVGGTVAAILCQETSGAGAYALASGTSFVIGG